MQILLSTLLHHVNVTLRPFLFFPAAVSLKKAEILHAPTFSLYPLMPVNLCSRARANALKHFSRRVDNLHVFTKDKNPNKLFLDNNAGLFLSAGIILKFINLDQSRFLKKRLRTWYGYVKALQLLQKKAFVMYFSDLNGKKSIFLNKVKASNIRVSWLLIKLFRNNHIIRTKKARRIKRWIRKKYYQLEVGEKR